jgi:hypothetical protein
MTDLAMGVPCSARRRRPMPEEGFEEEEEDDAKNVWMGLKTLGTQ